VFGKILNVYGDSTTWHNQIAALEVPAGAQAVKLRVRFLGTAPGATPVRLDEIAVFELMRGGGRTTTVAVEPAGDERRRESSLELYLTPNPTAGRVHAQFRLESAEALRLDVFDLQGRRVRTLIDRFVAEGRHEVEWNGVDDDGRFVAPGVYICRMAAGNRAVHRKITLVR